MQCPEMILNKFEKTFNKTYTGLMSFLQRFQICFAQNLAVRARNPPARQYSRYGLKWADMALLPSWWIPCLYS